MKLWSALFLLAVAGGCSGGPAGNGDVVSCSCDVAWINTNDNLGVTEGSMAISLCESSFATDHSADAVTQCEALADKTDTENQGTHLCACSCVHLTQRCDLP